MAEFASLGRRLGSEGKSFLWKVSLCLRGEGCLKLKEELYLIQLKAKRGFDLTHPDQ